MGALVANTTIAGTGGGSGPFTSASVDTTGASLLIAVTARAYFWPVSVTDSKGNTWSPAVGVDNPIFSNMSIHYARNPIVGSGHTFTIGGAGTAQMSTSIAAFSGVKISADPLDQVNEATDTGHPTTLKAGSITPSVDGCLIICGVETSGSDGQTVSIDSSLSVAAQVGLLNSNYYGTGLGYIFQGSAAAINPEWTISGGASNFLIAGIASFLPAPVNNMTAALSESGDSTTGLILTGAPVAIAVQEGADNLSASLLVAKDIVISSIEQPDSINIQLGFNLTINISSEEADTMHMVLDNPGSWSACTDTPTDWTDCPPQADTWAQCTDPVTDWNNC